MFYKDKIFFQMDWNLALFGALYADIQQRFNCGWLWEPNRTPAQSSGRAQPRPATATDHLSSHILLALDFNTVHKWERVTYLNRLIFFFEGVFLTQRTSWRSNSSSLNDVLLEYRLTWAFSIQPDSGWEATGMGWVGCSVLFSCWGWGSGSLCDLMILELTL